VYVIGACSPIFPQRCAADKKSQSDDGVLGVRDFESGNCAVYRSRGRSGKKTEHRQTGSTRSVGGNPFGRFLGGIRAEIVGSMRFQHRLPRHRKGHEL